VNWAEAQLGSTAWDGLCQAFVHDAYLQGAGVEIGGAPSAVDYWNAHPDLQHPGDAAPPLGALVYWGATSYNPYGHVGLSLGDGQVVSSYEETTSGVHNFSLAARNAAGYPYLGWLQVG
jgi:cell wall-associated NlpC family hydrolase